MLESSMVSACYTYIKSNWNPRQVVCEVPFLSRCIDMVMVTSENETITIEFKIKNWRQAIEQAKNHKLGADRAYICLPSRNPSEALVQALEEEELGLFMYEPNNPNTIVRYLEAPKNDSKISVFASLLNEKVGYIANL